MKKRILIADFVEHLLIKGLEERSFEVLYEPRISRPEVRALAGSLSGIVINTRTPVDREMMEAATSLEWIARLGSGLDIVDLREAKKRRIEVLNTPEGNANAVAEHLLGMLLSLANNICRANLEMRSLDWHREKNRGWELSEKTVGIIGFGNTGSAFARVLEGFRCRILAFDKYKQHYSKSHRFVEEMGSMGEVTKTADVVSLHLPLTDETNQMADDNFFSCCKKGAVFCNTSRGGIVNTASLNGFLKSGHLRGACLDVFENEKPKSWNREEAEVFSALSKMDNVALTPHIAGWTKESKIKIAKTFLKKLDKII